jgi:hypothetical protein
MRLPVGSGTASLVVARAMLEAEWEHVASLPQLIPMMEVLLHARLLMVNERDSAMVKSLGSPTYRALRLAGLWGGYAIADAVDQYVECVGVDGCVYWDTSTCARTAGMVWNMPWTKNIEREFGLRPEYRADTAVSKYVTLGAARPQPARRVPTWLLSSERCPTDARMKVGEKYVQVDVAATGVATFLQFPEINVAGKPLLDINATREQGLTGDPMTPAYPDQNLQAINSTGSYASTLGVYWYPNNLTSNTLMLVGYLTSTRRMSPTMGQPVLAQQPRARTIGFLLGDLRPIGVAYAASVALYSFVKSGFLPLANYKLPLLGVRSSYETFGDAAGSVDIASYVFGGDDEKQTFRGDAGAKDGEGAPPTAE